MEEKILFKCRNNIKKRAFIFFSWLLFALSLIGFLVISCIAMLDGISFSYWIKNWVAEYCIFLGGCILVSIISMVIFIVNQKCKFIVTENKIYGKKGCKSFDIPFSNIIEIIQKRKGIIIKTENKKLKLSPLKNYDEIYNYIKPFVPERTTTQQSTSTVDDIKLF